MKVSYFIIITFCLFIGISTTFQKDKSYSFYPQKKEVLKFLFSTAGGASINSSQIDALSKKGKRLFFFNCATCHNKNMKDDLTGPALGGVKERWKGREALLYEFIRNSQAVIHDKKDPYSVELYNKWNKSLMDPFPKMTDEKIDSILDYIDYMYQK